MAVWYAGKESESPIDLDWAELGNYGAVSEVGRYLENREAACDYDGLQSRAEVDAFKVCAKDNFLRERKENSAHLYTIYGGNARGESKFGFQNESNCR